MKKILLTLGLVGSLGISAQYTDLYSLARGEHLSFNAVYDQDDNLFGYVSVYGYGKSSDKTKRFEYIFLDKNLNPVANKQFDGDITSYKYYGKLDFDNNLLLIPYADEQVKWKDFFSPKRIVVDLKTNTIQNKVYYDYQRGEFREIAEPKNNKEILKEERKERKKNGFIYLSNVYEIKQGGYIVIEREDYGSYVKNQTLKRYDKNKNRMWEYRFNEEGTKKKREYLEIIEMDDKHLYALLTKQDKKEKKFFFQVIDMKTGKILHNQFLEELSQNTWDYILSVEDVWQSVENRKGFDNKIVVVARLYDNNTTNVSHGFVRWLIDKNTFQTKVDILNYTDFQRYLPNIDKYGRVENGYRMAVKDFFFLNDGSVGLLFEKFKESTNNSTPHKTSDIIYAFTNQDFQLRDVKVLDKVTTQTLVHSDYLFSQYLNQGKDIAFFYRDYRLSEETNEKHWHLYINTVIGGKFNQEVIRISEKDKYFITPYVAKEGYILLREVNENAKYNKIRLEKINY